jgi:hypothetical protein
VTGRVAIAVTTVGACVARRAARLTRNALAGAALDVLGAVTGKVLVAILVDLTGRRLAAFAQQADCIQALRRPGTSGSIGLSGRDRALIVVAGPDTATRRGTARLTELNASCARTATRGVAACVRAALSRATTCGTRVCSDRAAAA